MRRLRAAVSAAVLAAGLAAPAVVAPAASAGACNPTGQNVRVTHNASSTTVTILTRMCGMSYAAWLRDANGHKFQSAWHTANPGTAWDVYGHNFTGGWVRVRTGVTNATRIYHTSY